MNRRIDPVTMARIDEGRLRLRHRLAGPNDGDLADGKLITIPPSLAAVQCPGCTSRTPSGRGADFVHDAGCVLAEELEDERQADREELVRLRGAGHRPLLDRPATGAEIDLWAAWDTDAAGARVVVQLDEDDEPRYWWPTLQPDC